MLPSLRISVARGVRFTHTVSGNVPAPRGNIKEPADFLSAIGRNCDEYATKFETWESLFITDSRTMRNEFAIPTKQRKYILAWREWYRQGQDLHAVPVAKPKKKK
ncbi:IGR protein motif-domain-containing protein [Dichotomocladium elegans]|nr:IGR protein motif-domain-containing protein [Dichotomocladium elegans]